jgi:diguanylate cyclase (GGDEF)-like protein
MGSTLQKILPGRGDKEGQGNRLKRGALLLLLFISWLFLLADFPVTHPLIWFPLSAVAVLVYAFFIYSAGERELSTEFLLASLIIISGIISALKLQWLKLIFFPVVVAIIYFYPVKVIFRLSLLVPVVGMKDSLSGFVSFLLQKTPFSTETLIEEAAFSLALMLSAVVAGVMSERQKKQKDDIERSLGDIREKAKWVTREAGMESLSNDEMTVHYLASERIANEEIKELLLTIKKAVLADSANFFVPCSKGLELRCTTEDRDYVVTDNGGVIAACLRERQTFSSGNLTENAIDLGYHKKGKTKITSVIAIPISESSAVIGVLAVDSSRYQAFSGIEGTEKTVGMFADHLGRILERQRISRALNRELSGLKILERESSSLVASLKIDEISEKLCKVAEKISGGQSFFFIIQGRNFELKYHTSAVREGPVIFNLSGTIVNFAVENRHRHYVPDLRNYASVNVMPFETEGVLSAMAIPLIYENALLGLLVILSREANFLDASRINLLDIFCNQASTSIANAMLHARIEKMATTDGLTGLFNHRIFQEKLSEQFNRLKRFPEPISLVLADIDHFKRVNDTYGHPVGDLVLKGVAQVLKETIRDIDIPARYGGEEFAVILPGTSSEGARNIAERLRQKVKGAPFSSNGRRIDVSVSIGIATSPSDAKSKEGLIERADKALYHAKRNGRDRCVVWSGISQ